MKKTKESRGITLIALVITIIILLILAGVTIATLTGENGILTQAQNAKRETTKAEAEEQFALIANEWMIAKRVGDKTLEQFINDKIKEGKLTGVADNGDGTYTIEINGSKKIIDQNGGLNNPFDTASWDENASSEDCFIWLSDDPNSEDYGTIIGYTSKASTYATLKYPSRCKRVEFTYNEERYNNASTTYSDARAFVRNIKEVELPGTVTTIGDYAFSGDGWHYFSSLEKINIPNSVASIGTSAFYGCSNLSGTITISNKVTSIESSTFSGCSNLNSVTIPESVTSIGTSAFYNCTSLSSINMPESITSIGERAFYCCTSLSSVNIPKGVTEIGDKAFTVCTNLKTIDVDNDNQQYSTENGLLLNKDKTTVIYCANGISETTIPESVTSIGYGAFMNCINLNSIKIPINITIIEDYTFYSCSSLSSVEIPESITSIGSYAFWNCDSLSSLIIPNGVTSIGSYAFQSCESLTSINIPNKVTVISRNTFDGCKSLSSIIIPDSVTTIGAEAFYGCKSLNSIIIPKSVTTVRFRVFYYWSENQTIYCRASSKPSGWDSRWDRYSSSTARKAKC